MGPKVGMYPCSHVARRDVKKMKEKREGLEERKRKAGTSQRVSAEGNNIASSSNIQDVTCLTDVHCSLSASSSCQRETVTTELEMRVSSSPFSEPSMKQGT
jgi:hypothetical protein